MQGETCYFWVEQGLVDEAYEEGLHMLRLCFPEKRLRRAAITDAQLAYVVKHPTDEVVCIISSMAHKHLRVQLNDPVQWADCNILTLA